MVKSAAAVIIIAAVIAGVIAVVGGGSSSKQTVGGGGSGDGGGGVDGWFVGTSIGDAGYQTQLSTSPNGTAWTARQLKEPLTGGLAWANGKWLALSLVGETSVLESTDLRSWSSVTTVPAKLHDIAYGDGQWIAVGGESDNDIGHGVVYTSADRARNVVVCQQNSPPVYWACFRMVREGIAVKFVEPQNRHDLNRLIARPSRRLPQALQNLRPTSMTRAPETLSPERHHSETRYFRHTSF